MREKKILASKKILQPNKTILNFQILNPRNSKFPYQFLELIAAEVLYKKGIEVLPLFKNNCYQISFLNLESLIFFLEEVLLAHKFTKPKKKKPFIIQFAFEILPNNIFDKRFLQLIENRFNEINIRLRFNLKIKLYELIFPSEETYILLLLAIIQDLNLN